MRIPIRMLAGAMAAALFGVASLASPALGADKYYVKFEGIKQGSFKGAIQRNGSPWIEIVSFGRAVASPRDAASGQGSGKREHSPILIVKEADAASPQIAQAARSNEVLREVVIQSVHIGPNGKEQVYQTIQLTNALIANVERVAGSTRNEAERIRLTYQKIEVTDSKGGVTATDDWQSP